MTFAKPLRANLACSNANIQDSMDKSFAHHYVPQTYLKQFANDQKKLYQLDKSSGMISPKTIAQICYQLSYYTIVKEETKLVNNISDPNFIEKKAFVRHENNYGKILPLLTVGHRSDFIADGDKVRLFLETLVSMKRRNPVFKQRVNNDSKNHYSSQKFMEDFKPYIEISRKIDPSTDPVEYIKNHINYVVTDAAKQSDMYLSRLLPGNSDILKEVVQTLWQFKLLIYHAPSGCEFLSSDNPGFVVAGNEVINLGGLNGDFIFYFR